MAEGFSLYDNCTMMQLSEEVFANCEAFSCGNPDLDDFFLNDARKYAEELMGKTYCWVTDSKPYKIVALFTLANDSIKTTYLASSAKNRINRPIDNPKRGRSYPAALIGRLGVNVEFQGLHIGSQLIAFIKSWFRAEDNKTGCRFLVVDAYNSPRTLKFYEKNGFRYLHKDDEEERCFYRIIGESVSTRLMYFDLKNR